jgi:hypothetical protein
MSMSYSPNHVIHQLTSPPGSTSTELGKCRQGSGTLLRYSGVQHAVRGQEASNAHCKAAVSAASHLDVGRDTFRIRLVTQNPKSATPSDHSPRSAHSIIRLDRRYSSGRITRTDIQNGEALFQITHLLPRDRYRTDRTCPRTYAAVHCKIPIPFQNSQPALNPVTSSKRIQQPGQRSLGGETQHLNLE